MKRKLLLSLCGLTAVLALAQPAFAILTSDSTNIGAHPSYGSNYSAFWRSGSDYSLITNGTHTFVNAPSTTGAIMFRGNNTASPGVTSPDGSTSRAFIDSSSNFVVAGGITASAQIGGTSQTAQGVLGTSNGSNTAAVEGDASVSTSFGVYGHNSASSGTGVKGDTLTGNGVFGLANGVAGNGVFGESFDSTGRGVYGLGASGGYGIYGKTTSTTIAAVFGESGSSSSGLAFSGIGNITITGNTATKQAAGSWAGTSDIRTKKDVKPYTQGLTDIERINPISYRYNGLGGTINDGIQYVGVSAQDLEKVLPKMVSSKTVKLNPTDGASTAIKQMDPSDFTYLLINSVKELNARVKELESQMNAMKAAQRK